MDKTERIISQNNSSKVRAVKLAHGFASLESWSAVTTDLSNQPCFTKQKQTNVQYQQMSFCIVWNIAEIGLIPG